MKERTQKGEKIGGGFLVFRRGRKSNRVKPSWCPFEHPSAEAAKVQADKLAKENPESSFVVLQVIDTSKAEPAMKAEANA